jgi:hypothetical protein
MAVGARRGDVLEMLVGSSCRTSVLTYVLLTVLTPTGQQGCFLGVRVCVLQFAALLRGVCVVKARSAASALRRIALSFGDLFACVPVCWCALRGLSAAGGRSQWPIYGQWDETGHWHWAPAPALRPWPWALLQAHSSGTLVVVGPFACCVFCVAYFSLRPRSLHTRYTYTFHHLSRHITCLGVGCRPR